MPSPIRFAALAALVAAAVAADPSPYARWTRGPSTDPGYFPIAVWLQSPGNAAAYRAAGVNLYVGLWEGPTEAQLGALAAAGMPVICDQNAVGLAHVADRTIVGWMHGDEPDNAQADGSGGYGPPILPSVIQAQADAIRRADPTRPVYLNLGQGVSYADYIGRGTRRNHPEDYAQYLVGADIGSFDIYPVNSPYPEVAGNLWFVPQGVTNLRTWSGDKPSWCWIECTRIGADAPAAPTPAQVRSEVWMALIAGARGIGYFCHSWSPSFVEAKPLADPPILAAITAIDLQITRLAPALNSPTVAGAVTVASSAPAVPIATMVKRWNGDTYVFACAMRAGATTATFALAQADAAVEVLDEHRSLRLAGGHFSDAFSDYGVHLYRIAGAAGGTTTGGTTTGGATTGGTTGSGSGDGHSSNRGCGAGAAGAMAAAGAMFALARRDRLR